MVDHGYAIMLMLSPPTLSSCHAETAFCGFTSQTRSMRHLIRHLVRPQLTSLHLVLDQEESSDLPVSAVLAVARCARSLAVATLAAMAWG